MIDCMPERKQVKLLRRLSVCLCTCQLIFSLLGTLFACVIHSLGDINGLTLLMGSQLSLSLINFFSAAAVFASAFSVFKGKVERINYSQFKQIRLAVCCMCILLAVEAISVSTLSLQAGWLLEAPGEAVKTDSFVYGRVAADFETSFAFKSCSILAEGTDARCLKKRWSVTTTDQLIQSTCLSSDRRISGSLLKSFWCRAYPQFAEDWTSIIQIIEYQVYISLALSWVQLVIFMYIGPWIKANQLFTESHLIPGYSNKGFKFEGPPVKKVTCLPSRVAR